MAWRWEQRWHPLFVSFFCYSSLSLTQLVRYAYPISKVCIYMNVYVDGMYVLFFADQISYLCHYDNYESTYFHNFVNFTIAYWVLYFFVYFFYVICRFWIGCWVRGMLSSYGERSLRHLWIFMGMRYLLQIVTCKCCMDYGDC